MGSQKAHPPVKLVCGFIYRDAADYLRAKKYIVQAFGPIDFESPEFAFTHTDYYQQELGLGLKRKFTGYLKLINPAVLPTVKLKTNAIEIKLSARGNRTVNIDPGYLDLGKLVLASTKDFSHRIYLNRGIYAEVTLFFAQKTFQSWPWSYPDYKTGESVTFFNQVRSAYAEQIKG